MRRTAADQVRTDQAEEADLGLALRTFAFLPIDKVVADEGADLWRHRTWSQYDDRWRRFLMTVAESNGRGLSLREVARRIGCRSRTTVLNYVRRAEREGLLVRSTSTGQLLMPGKPMPRVSSDRYETGCYPVPRTWTAERRARLPAEHRRALLQALHLVREGQDPAQLREWLRWGSHGHQRIGQALHRQLRERRRREKRQDRAVAAAMERNRATLREALGGHERRSSGLDRMESVGNALSGVISSLEPRRELEIENLNRHYVQRSGSPGPSGTSSPSGQFEPRERGRARGPASDSASGSRSGANKRRSRWNGGRVPADDQEGMLADVLEEIRRQCGRIGERHPQSVLAGLSRRCQPDRSLVFWAGRLERCIDAVLEELGIARERGLHPPFANPAAVAWWRCLHLDWSPGRPSAPPGAAAPAGELREAAERIRAHIEHPVLDLAAAEVQLPAGVDESAGYESDSPELIARQLRMAETRGLVDVADRLRNRLGQLPAGVPLEAQRPTPRPELEDWPPPPAEDPDPQDVPLIAARRAGEAAGPYAARIQQLYERGDIDPQTHRVLWTQAVYEASRR